MWRQNRVTGLGVRVWLLSYMDRHLPLWVPASLSFVEADKCLPFVFWESQQRCSGVGTEFYKMLKALGWGSGSQRNVLDGPLVWTGVVTHYGLLVQQRP